MIYVLVGILCAGIGVRYGYWLKEKEIEEGSLLEAVLPDPIERKINEVTGRKVFKVEDEAADMDKGHNND